MELVIKDLPVEKKLYWWVIDSLSRTYDGEI
jgi:hypothetical protein